MDYTVLARDGIIHSSDYLRDHRDTRDLTRAVARGDLVKLRRGAYVEAIEWENLDPQGQHLVRCRLALAGLQREYPLTGFSAAAVWGMWVREFPDYVTILDRWKGGGRSEPGVRRVSAAVGSAVIQRRDGMLVSSVARTVLEVARHGDFATALGSVDWALREKNPDGVSRDDLFAELEKLPLSVGRRHLDRCIRTGSGKSDSYGESLARALMIELGYELPEQQVRYEAPRKTYFADFTWRKHAVIAEFDGKGKYLNDEWNGKDPGEAVWREKLREDYLRSCGYTVIRLFWSDLLHPERLIAKLDAVGIPRGRR